MRNYFKLLKREKGFTLIELLVVIGILGILAATVLVAIDPLEQLARGRDAGRKTAVAQLGHALQAYFTANTYYPVHTTPIPWYTTLTTSGDVKIFPSAVAGAPVTGADCTNGNANANYCYKPNATAGPTGTATDFVVYTHMESKVEKGKFTCAGSAANTWFVYNSAYGKSGTVCGAAQPTTLSTPL